jgi:hypothetical protein
VVGGITPGIAAAFEAQRAAFIAKHGREPEMGDGMLKEEMPPLVTPALPTVEFVAKSKEPEEPEPGESEEGSCS